MKTKRILVNTALLLLALCIGLYYLSLSVRDVPIMDYWRTIQELAPAVMEHDLQFSSLWQDYIGQRNVLLKAICAWNIQFLNLNCAIESYLGMGTMVLSMAFIGYFWFNLIKKIRADSPWMLKYGTLIPIGLAFLTLNQWEILSLQFSFAFQIRIFVYLLVIYLLDKEMKCKQVHYKRYCFIGILCAVAICFLSQLYFPALLLSVFVVFVFYIFVERKGDKTVIYGGALFFLPAAIGCCIYFYGLSGVGADNSISVFISSLLNGNIFKGLLFMLVGSLLPESMLQPLPDPLILAIGLILLLIVILAVVVFLKGRLYQYTYFPAMVAGYGLISLPIIIYGRLGAFDLRYLMASRYVCETRLIWVGCVMVFGMALIKGCPRKNALLVLIPTMIIGCMTLWSDVKEMHIAPYRGAYKDELISVLMRDNIEYEMDDTIFTPFQAPADTVRNAVKYMKQYRLWAYSENGTVGSDQEQTVLKERIYEDGWVENGGTLQLKTCESGKISLSIYNPYAEKHPEGTCTIYINDTPKETFVVEENMDLLIDGEPNAINRITFQCSYSEQADAPDVRQELCFVLLKFECIP